MPTTSHDKDETAPVYGMGLSEETVGAANQKPAALIRRRCLTNRSALDLPRATSAMRNLKNNKGHDPTVG
jgi:hypothetical protein